MIVEFSMTVELLMIVTKKKFDVRKDNRCNNFETRKTVFDSFIIKLPLLISSVLTRLYSLMMKT